MLTALMLIVPVVLAVLFYALVKVALSEFPRQEQRLARAASSREPVQQLESLDRRAA